MIDHVSIAVRDLEKSARFYDRLLPKLGMRRIADRPRTIGYGKRYPELWLNVRSGMPPVAEDSGAHVALRARSREIVDEFHAEALAAGGCDDGAPGPRQAELTEYYGAFVRDPDGNRIEIVTFPVADDPKP